MSLNSEQRAATIREFQENMSRLGLTAERIGKDFGVSGSRVEQIITLKSGVLEYPWIIRAYLLSRAETQGVELTPFMALRGNPHDYWFLDGDFIDRGEIDQNRLIIGHLHARGAVNRLAHRGHRSPCRWRCVCSIPSCPHGRYVRRNAAAPQDLPDWFCGHSGKPP